MKSYDQYDEWFVQTAVDDSLRPELIKLLSRKRTTTFWLAIGISLSALGLMFLEAVTTKNPVVIAVQFFVTAMSWMLVLKFENDLRLLRLVEKLRSLSTR
jgi:hypothetical protein